MKRVQKKEEGESIRICFIKLTKEEETQPETQVYRQIIQQEDAQTEPAGG